MPTAPPSQQRPGQKKSWNCKGRTLSSLQISHNPTSQRTGPHKLKRTRHRFPTGQSVARLVFLAGTFFAPLPDASLRLQFGKCSAVFRIFKAMFVLVKRKWRATVHTVECHLKDRGNFLGFGTRERLRNFAHPCACDLKKTVRGALLSAHLLPKWLARRLSRSRRYR
jgi:hypothetical protein